MFGTWVNIGTVLAGSLLGLAIGGRLPEKIRKSVFTALALVTLSIGIGMAIKGTRPLVIISSIVVGVVIGELIGVEQQLERLASWLQRRVKAGEGEFVKGFVTASLLFCVGPMTVVGSIQDGLSGDSQVLVTKAVMDGFASLALAATMGIGVIFSAVTVLVVQGSLSLAGRSLAMLTEPVALNQLTAVGGLLIIALAIRMLELKDIRVGNFLPALVIVALLVVFL
jgi:hypothetical protein